MRLAISCLVASRMVESKSTTSKVNCALAHASPEESAHSISITTVSSIVSQKSLEFRVGELVTLRQFKNA